MDKSIKDTNTNNKDKDSSKESKPIELSEEDKEYKSNLDDMVNALYDKEYQLVINSFNLIKQEITNSTGTMTSIPRPLKFFREHYEALREYYLTLEVTDTLIKPILGNLLSILVLVAKEPKETILSYIIGNNLKTYGDWGQEYIRSLSGEIGTEYLKRLDSEQQFDDLKNIITDIVPMLIKLNNESEAMDLLIELEMLDDIKQHCNTTNYKKICQYLIASSNYAADSEEQLKILNIVYELYTTYNEATNALRIAIKLNETTLINSTFQTADKTTQLQMCYILAREKISYETTDDNMNSIINNMKLSETFKRLGRSLEIEEPRHPEEIFKSHLEDKKSDVLIESAKSNQSSSIASSFINAGFCTESLLSKKDNNWLSKNKEEGLICALGGLGLVNIWDIECGPNEIEKYMDQNEMNPYKRGGYNIGLGIISSGVKDDNNTAFALLVDQLNDKK